MKLTIQRNGVVVARLVLKHIGGGDYEIEWLRVDVDHRGKGFASRLVEKAKEIVQRKGNALVGYLEPTDGLTAEQMKSFLARHGFKHGWYQFDHGLPQQRVMIWTVENEATDTARRAPERTG